MRAFQRHSCPPHAPPLPFSASEWFGLTTTNHLRRRFALHLSLAYDIYHSFKLDPDITSEARGYVRKGKITRLRELGARVGAVHAAHLGLSPTYAPPLTHHVRRPQRLPALPSPSAVTRFMPPRRLVVSTRFFPVPSALSPDGPLTTDRDPNRSADGVRTSQASQPATDRQADRQTRASRRRQAGRLVPGADAPGSLMPPLEPSPAAR